LGIFSRPTKLGPKEGQGGRMKMKKRKKKKKKNGRKRRGSRISCRKKSCKGIFGVTVSKVPLWESFVQKSKRMALPSFF
jgi:hypothetical protein